MSVKQKLAIATVIAGLIPAGVMAEVPVIDALQKDEKTEVSQSPASDSVNLLQRIDELEQKMRDMQGAIEVQQHLLQTMTAKQQLWFEDVNSRLSRIPSGIKQETPDGAALDAAKNADTETKAALSSLSSQDVVTPAGKNDEKQSYQSAYHLVQLRAFPEAIKAFNNFLTNYPETSYAPNVHYWLGELYLQQGRYLDAKHEFSMVIEKFPNHIKAADASLKLSYVYSNMGDANLARQQLLTVTELYPTTPSARIASERLQQSTG